MSATYSISIPEFLDKIFVWPVLLYRRLTFGEPYRRIYLGDGVYTKVDPDVYYEKCFSHWYLSYGNKSYAARTLRFGPKESKKSLLHREILKIRKGKIVDHRDNDPFNNLRSNLREASYSQNAMNRPKRKNTSSKYIGVSWHKNHKKWHATIRCHRQGRSVTKFLGHFRDEIKAARAHDIAALKYHKDFANLNFPRDNYIKTRTGYKYAGKAA